MQKIRWQRRFYFYILPACRMHKTKAICMERLTLQMKRCLSLSVYLISQERMPNGRHVHPNLVGSSRLQAALDIGIIPKTFQHLIMCDSLFSIFLPAVPSPDFIVFCLFMNIPKIHPALYYFTL